MLMTKAKIDDDSELRPEYNLRNLRVRRVGSKRSDFGNYTIHLAPDVAEVFPDPEKGKKT